MGRVPARYARLAATLTVRLAAPPRLTVAGVPAVDAPLMHEVDRLAIDEFGIELAQMMELAGASLARLAQTLHGALAGQQVTVLVGPGGNGGGGLVAARHLANRGAQVHCVLAVPAARLRPLQAERLATLIAMGVRCCAVPWDVNDGELDELLGQSGLVLDALLGYSAAGALRGELGQLVSAVSRQATPVISLDVPTGIDPTTGRAADVALRAVATLALALPKSGLLRGDGPAHRGSLYLADIGLPKALYARLGLAHPDPFAGGSPVGLD